MSVSSDVSETAAALAATSLGPAKPREYKIPRARQGNNSLAARYRQPCHESTAPCPPTTVPRPALAIDTSECPNDSPSSSRSQLSSSPLASSAASRTPVSQRSCPPPQPRRPKRPVRANTTPTAFPVRSYDELRNERAYLLAVLRTNEASVASLARRCADLEKRAVRDDKTPTGPNACLAENSEEKADTNNATSKGNKSSRQLRNLRSRIVETSAQQQTVVLRLAELCTEIQAREYQHCQEQDTRSNYQIMSPMAGHWQIPGPPFGMVQSPSHYHLQPTLMAPTMVAPLYHPAMGVDFSSMFALQCAGQAHQEQPLHPLQQQQQQPPQQQQQQQQQQQRDPQVYQPMAPAFYAYNPWTTSRLASVHEDRAAEIELAPEQKAGPAQTGQAHGENRVGGVDGSHDASRAGSVGGLRVPRARVVRAHRMSLPSLCASWPE